MTDLHTQSPGICVEAASLHYQETTLFEHLDFTARSEKCTCILGPSGIGKTSLLRMIAGLIEMETPTAITASDKQALPPRIAYMAQNDLLLPWLNALENVLIGYRLRSSRDASLTKQALALLNDVGLRGAAYQRIQTLSGGMRQRVALARTLMEEKPVILMDEPFARLDAITRLALQTLTATLLKNKTVIFITHDPLEALRLAHTIHIMSGSPATLSEPIVPEGSPPRQTEDDTLLHLQGELLTRLSAAQDAWA